MAQFIYTMNRVGKVVPPKRIILRDISLSFFPGAKIGVLGLNGSGKSTLLKIMSGVDKDIEGEARAQAGIKVGYLPQEPLLDEAKTVRQVVGEGQEAGREVTVSRREVNGTRSDVRPALAGCLPGERWRHPVRVREPGSGGLRDGQTAGLELNLEQVLVDLAVIDRDALLDAELDDRIAVDAELL